MKEWDMEEGWRRRPKNSDSRNNEPSKKAWQIRKIIERSDKTAIAKELTKRRKPLEREI